MKAAVKAAALPVPKKIRGIYLRNCSSRTLGDFNPLNSGQKLGGELEIRSQFVATHELSDKTNVVGIVYLTVFKFTYRHIADAKRDVWQPSDEIVAEVEAQFAAEYLDLPQPFERPAQENYGAFAVMAQVWPYWREYLQSALSRMSLPIVTLPPMYASLEEQRVSVGIPPEPAAE